MASSRARRGCYARSTQRLQGSLQAGVLDVRARFLNTSRRALVAPGPEPAPRRRSWRGLPLVLVLTACCTALSACASSGSSGPDSLLNATFRSHAPIESGRISLSFTLAPVGTIGSVPVKAPLSLHLEGPFQSTGSGRLPDFALQARVPSGGLLGGGGPALQVGATSTGGKLFIELGGTAFLAPAATVQALQQGYLQATRSAGAAPGGSTFAALGIDPGEWLAHPTIVGSGELDGTHTVHIVAGLNPAHFFADASRLSSAGGSFGLSTGAQAGLFAPSAAAAFEHSLRSARVDVYTGAEDHLLRELSVRVDLAATPNSKGALGGLRSAVLTLELQFAALNQPQKIVAPGNQQPISQLLTVLERLGLTRSSGPGG